MANYRPICSNRNIGISEKSFLLTLVLIIILSTVNVSAVQNCSDVLISYFQRKITTNLIVNPILIVSLDSNGTHDFTLPKVLKYNSVFDVEFHYSGKIEQAVNQEFIPKTDLYIIEQTQIESMINFLHSVELFNNVKAYWLDYYGYLEEVGMVPGSNGKIVKEPNKNWRNDTEFINLASQKAENIAKNGVEIGFYIVVGASGKIYTSSMFTSLSPQIIYNGDSNPTLKELQKKMGTDSIKAIHYYHLHPKGSPLSPSDVDDKTNAFGYSGYGAIEWHISAIVLDDSRRSTLGIFHHGINLSSQFSDFPESN